MSLLIDKTIKDFSDLLASSEPAPGGGSTAALSGLLASSLTMMVVNLSIGKKSYEALPEDVKAAMLEDFARIKTLNAVLLGLVDEDTKAFMLFMEALKMPKATDEDKLIRSKAMQKASEYALAVPLTVAKKCLEILEHQAAIAKYGNKNAVSDIGVGSAMALAGLEGAVLNVKINLSSVADEQITQDACQKIHEYLANGRRLNCEIMKIVEKRIEEA